MLGEGVRQGVLSATGAEERPKSLGQAALNIGEEGLGQGLGEVGGRLLAKPAEWAIRNLAPAKLYGKALKPTVTLTPAERQELIQTGLGHKIPVSGSGIEQTGGLIRNLDQQVENLIQAKSQVPGMEIPPREVIQPLLQTRARFATQVTPESDVAAVDQARKEFMRQHTTAAPYTKIQPNPYSPPGGPVTFVPAGSGVTRTPVPLTLEEAQALKKGTYGILRGKYGELGSADTEAQKGLARGLKTAIEQRVPEVRPLNLEQGKLLDLEEPLIRSVGGEENRPIIGPWQVPMLSMPSALSHAAIWEDKIRSSLAGRLLGPFVRPGVSLPFIGKMLANRGQQREQEPE
jgi:hypothetical protein